jgi:hypothetical protein
MNYFWQYFGINPHAHLSLDLSGERGAGETVWNLYAVTIEAASKHASGRGIPLCRKSENRWQIPRMYAF